MSSGGGNETGVGGAGGASAAGVQGAIFEYNDFLFATTTASDAEALVYGFSATTMDTVSVLVQSGKYNLEEAAQSLQAFMSVFPTDSNTYVTTIYTVDSTDGKEDLALVTRADLEEIYALQGVNASLSKGTVVVQAVDSSGNAVSGVSITSKDAEAILYRNLGSYVPGLAETDSTGTAILLNTTASAFPGGFASITFSTKATPVTVRVAEDAVTFVRVRL